MGPLDEMYPFKCTKVIFTCDVRTEHMTILLGCVSLIVGGVQKARNFADIIRLNPSQCIRAGNMVDLRPGGGTFDATKVTIARLVLENANLTYEVRLTR